MEFITQCFDFKKLKTRIDTDLVDKIFFKFTVTLLLVLAFLVSARQYVGQPIQCWVPAQFTMAMEQYTENYCYVQNTYWVPLDRQIPHNYQDRTRTEISYYQWVPFILLAQAVSLILPFFLWKAISDNLSGMNLNTIDQLATECQTSDIRYREKIIESLAFYLHSAILVRKPVKPILFSAERLQHNSRLNRLAILFVFNKIVYLAVAVGQLFFIGKLMQPAGADKTYFHGMEVISKLLKGQQWSDSGVFPRVTFCDFTVRVLGNSHRYTVQCVLMINLFNEKIFIFLWFWFLLLITCCIIGISFWLVQLIFTSKQLEFISHLLCLKSGKDRFYRHGPKGDRTLDPNPLRTALKLFVGDYLRCDGFLMIKLISFSSGTIVAAQLTSELWKQFIHDQMNNQFRKTNVQQQNHQLGDEFRGESPSADVVTEGSDGLQATFPSVDSFVECRGRNSPQLNNRFHVVEPVFIDTSLSDTTTLIAPPNAINTQNNNNLHDNVNCRTRSRSHDNKVQTAENNLKKSILRKPYAKV